jgi:hypothetical protein
MLFSKLWFVRFFSEYSNSPHRSPNIPGFEYFTRNFVASSIRPTTGNTVVKTSAIYAPNRNVVKWDTKDQHSCCRRCSACRQDASPKGVSEFMPATARRHDLDHLDLHFENIDNNFEPALVSIACIRDYRGGSHVSQ